MSILPEFLVESAVAVPQVKHRNFVRHRAERWGDGVDNVAVAVEEAGGEVGGARLSEGGLELLKCSNLNSDSRGGGEVKSGGGRRGGGRR